MRKVFGVFLTGAALALALGCGKGSGTGSGGGGGGGAGGSLDGTYAIVGVEEGPMKLTEAQINEAAAKMKAEFKVVLKGDQMTASMMGQEMSGTFKTDASKTPATIDMVEKKPDGKTETSYGIYKVDGDTLTICATGEGGKAEDRPTEFKAGGKSMMMTLKKKK